jgi:hypothetical protein
MLLALLLLAAPVADEVAGAPAPRAQLEAVELHAKLPATWYLEAGDLRTTRATAQLFDESLGGPRGAPSGTACSLTVPGNFPLAHGEISSRELAFTVIGHDIFYVPVVLKKPVTVAIWRNNAKGKDVVGEVMLGIMTLGLSTLRLVPTRAAWVSAPPNGRGTSGGFTLDCRVVGLDSVNAAVAPKNGKPCDTLACVAQDVSLLGPTRQELVEQAQRIADKNLRMASEWRARATWNLRSFEILSASHCGSTCVNLTVRNTSERALRFPQIDEALDANGRRVWVSDSTTGDIGAGETRVVKLSLSPSEFSDRGPTFPIVMRVQKDTWVHRVPGAFTEDGIEYRFTSAARCENGKALLHVTMRCLSGHNSTIDSLHLPWCMGNSFIDDDAWAWGDSSKPCPAIESVTGASTAPTYILIR